MHILSLRGAKRRGNLTFFNRPPIPNNQYRPRINEISVSFQLKEYLLTGSWPIQPDVVNIHRTRTTGCRHSGFTAQADRDLIHVGQIDPLIGKDL